MLLIQTDASEISTDYVIHWLKHFGVPFCRINETCKIDLQDFDIQKSIVLQIHYLTLNTTTTLNLSDVSSYWYRRGELKLNTIPATFQRTLDDEENLIYANIGFYVREEQKKIPDLLNQLFEQKNGVGKFSDNRLINKLYNLRVAHDLGINVPATSLCKHSQDLRCFVEKHGEAIFKGINRTDFEALKDYSFDNYTTLVDYSFDFSMLSEAGAYTLVQEHIRKTTDLRIFYLDGKIFSTAIFSQNDPQTRIDFRRYNDENPNRIQPFKLPNVEEEKIHKLMEKLDYKTGSIDYIYSSDKRFVFLEINPIGQYDFICKRANLFLDREIAEYFKQFEDL